MSTEHSPVFKKVLFRLEQDAQGYPPASLEGLWAQQTEAGYLIDSIPFYAYGIAPGDLISVSEADGEEWFAALSNSGGASVFRVLVKLAGALEPMRAALSEFGCPSEVEQAVKMLAGASELILVVGSTGSGKSTTLAAMIDHRNASTTGHILTIEDPIEFLHKHKKSIVNQREVGLDTHAFHNALKNAMREAPDVILIGEILDAVTMESAIAFAETGHLCMATLHSNNADQTLDRILNFFPESAHKNVLMNLALNLKAIISQRLVVGKDGKRLPAAEILINTPMIRDLIRRGEVHEIKEAMDKSLQEGMQTFDQSLFRMYKEGKVELEEALRKADSRDGLALKIRLSEGASGEHDPYGDMYGGAGPGSETQAY